MSEGVTVAEAKLIAIDAASSALKEHVANLPELMKPVVYEVSEKVAAKTTSDMRQLLNHVFGVDVGNEQHLRDLHKDLYFLRDQRINAEQRRAVARQEFVRDLVRGCFQAVLSAIVAVALLLGLNPHFPKVSP